MTNASNLRPGKIFNLHIASSDDVLTMLPMTIEAQSVRGIPPSSAFYAPQVRDKWNISVFFDSSFDITAS